MYTPIIPAPSVATIAADQCDAERPNRPVVGPRVQAMTNANKSDRLNLRVSPEQRRLLQAAAALEHKNLTAFILDAAQVRAEQQLADQRRFAVPPDRLAAFMEALERPPQTHPRLKRLLHEPSAIERQSNAPRANSPLPQDPSDQVL